MAFTAFAVLSFVLPPAVMAFGHGENTAHCLSKAGSGDHAMPSHAMNKADGTAHHAGHAVPASDYSTSAPEHQMTCCGLFCVSAVTADGGAVIENGLPTAHDPVAEPDPLTNILDRLDRPPIALLFV
jgi:hypothetical protein